MRPLFLCGCVFILLASTPAFAQSDAAKAQAIKRYQEGISLHDKGREEEAYLQFTQAYAVVQTPPILFNLARTEQLTGRHLAAAEHFRAYVALPVHPRVTKELRAKAQAFISELSGQVGHLVLDVPAGAAVSLDGKDIATLGTVDVEPGVHTVVARIGEQKGSVEVVAAAGAPVTAHIVLAAPAVAAVPAPAPPVTTPLATVIPLATPPAAPEAAKPPDNTARNVLGWTTAGVGVVGLAVGAGFLAGEMSKGSEFISFQASNPRACAIPSSATCGQAHTLSAANARDATISTTGFVVGGLAAACSAAVWLLWPTDQPTRSAAIWVAPTVGAGLHAVEVGGRF